VEIKFGAFYSLKIWHLVATVLLIFLRINWPQCVHWPVRWLDGVQPWK